MNDIYWIDSGKTGFPASVTPDTKRFTISFNKPAMLVIVAVFQACLFSRSEIVTSGNDCEIEKVTGIEVTYLGTLRMVHRYAFGYSITVACRADLCAGSATQTLVTPLLPDIGFEFDIKQVREVFGLHAGLIGVGDLFTRDKIIACVVVGNFAVLDSIKCHESTVGVDLDEIPVTQIGQEEIETVGNIIGTYHVTETIFARKVVNANHEHIAPPGDIVWVRIEVTGKYFVEPKQRVDVAGVHPDDCARRPDIFNFLLPVIIRHLEG